MKKDNITELLIKFYSNTCSTEEYEEVMSWLSDPLNDVEAQQIMKKHWMMLGEVLDNEELDSEKVLSKIKSDLDFTNGFKDSKINSITINTSIVYKIAAILVLALSFAFIYNFSKDSSNSISYTTYTTSKAEKDTVLLPDGSLAILSSLTKLKVSENYNSDRKLIIDGEAFFEVVKNANNPFIVNASNLSVTALGTSFSVKSNKKINKVNLITGKVSVEKANSDIKIILDPGDMALMDLSENKIFKGRTDQLADLGWISNILVFSENSFNEVIEILENNFNVDFDVQKSYDSRLSYSGKFKGQSLEEILELIAFSLEFEYKIQGNNIKIY